MSIEEILFSEQMKIIIGFLVGAIIGLERQLSTIKKEEERINELESEQELKPGVRTFGLLSLYGTVTVTFVEKYKFPEVFYFSILSAILIIAIYTIMKYQIKDYGLTTPVSLAISYILGIFVGVGEITLSITLSVLVTFILTSKGYVKSLLEDIEFKEIRSALEIGILIFLLFPIVPDANDPIFNTINLRTLYLFMVTLLTLSFLAYVAVKKLSPVKGALSFAAIGALFSSEGVAVSLMRIYKEDKSEPIKNLTLLGVILANTVMIIRTIAFTSLLLLEYPQIIVDLTIYILPSTLVGLVAIAYRYFEEQKVSMRKIYIENPLSYKTATKFVTIFLIISFLVVYFQKSGSHFGIFFGSFIGGFVSNLAVCLSIASLLINGSINTKTAEIAILLGTISGVLNKIIYIGAEIRERDIIRRVVMDIILLSTPLVIVIAYLLHALPF